MISFYNISDDHVILFMFKWLERKNSVGNIKNN